MGAPSNRTATLESQMIPMIQDVPGQTLRTVAITCVLLGDFLDLPKQATVEHDRLEAEADKTAVFDVQVVGVRFFARIGQMRNRHPSQSGNHLRQIDDPEGLGHLVEDAHTFAFLRRVHDRKFDTTNGILNVDERPRLTAGAMNGQWKADGCLHEKTIEDCSIITIIIESIDEPLIE